MIEANDLGALRQEFAFCRKLMVGCGALTIAGILCVAPFLLPLFGLLPKTKVEVLPVEEFRRMFSLPNSDYLPVTDCILKALHIVIPPLEEL